MNNVQITGRVARNLELAYTTSNKAYLKFSVAVDKNLSREKKTELEAKNLPTVDFINCTAWGNTAELISKYSAKGLKILIQGSLHQNTFETKGVKVTTQDVLVNSVEFIDWREKQTQNVVNEPIDEDFTFEFDPAEDSRIPF